MPQRTLLDVGCSTAALRSLLPGDFEYFGCDIADHARNAIDANHFLQIDINRECDLSFFANRGVNVVHIGGVLEYLHQPADLLRGLHNLLSSDGRLVLSIINFQSRRFVDRSTHHLGWVFKPSLDDMRRMLVAEGWAVEQEYPFFHLPRMREWLRQWQSRLFGMNHAWTRFNAVQFILIAKPINAGASATSRVQSNAA
jgi:SAM-dependent methyltransferase